MPRLKLYSSVGALITGGWCGAQLAPETPVSGAAFLGYLFWSLYWGVPPVWRWCWGLARRWLLGCNVLGLPLTIGLGLAAFFFSAYFYSVFGGGAYQCVKYLHRTRRRPSPTPPPP